MRERKGIDSPDHNCKERKNDVNKQFIGSAVGLNLKCFPEMI